MSTDTDTTGPTGQDLLASEATEPRIESDDSIVTIRNLLRKLEATASELPKADIFSVEPAPLPALATLRRTGHPNTGAASAFSPIEIATAAINPAATVIARPPRSQAAAVAFGIASFALGVVAAGAVIVGLGLNPFSGSRPATGVAVKAPPSAPPHSSVTEIAAAPAPTAIFPAPTATVAGPTSAAVTAVVHADNDSAAPATSPHVIPVATRATGFALAAATNIDLRIGERRSLALQLNPMPTDADSVLVVLRGVPDWLMLSKGSTIGENIWLLPGHQAEDLAFIAGEGAAGTVDIKVQVAHLDGRILAETRTSVRAVRPTQSTPLIAAVPEAGEQNVLRMLARGEFLLDTGELDAARVLFRSAAEAGSVAGALKLAQTFDPAEMQRLGMAETSADPTQAVRWYERAQALGSPAATARISALSPR